MSDKAIFLVVWGIGALLGMVVAGFQRDDGRQVAWLAGSMLLPIVVAGVVFLAPFIAAFWLGQQLRAWYAARKIAEMDRARV